MSAIFGIWHKDGAPVTAQTLDPIHDAMAHWGADAHGLWRQDAVGLGHLMLHTTPESLHEHLPGAHPALPDVVITADARIDNRDDLYAAFRIPATEHHTLPDSRLILLAYEKWGSQCAEHLLGDFAFVIWDGRQRRLFCARDHMGVQPFYYYDDTRFFVFASDIKGVLACPGVPRRLHEALLAASLQQHTYFAEKTLSFYDGIVKLPPAHHLSVNTTHTQGTPYWSLDNAPEIRLSSDASYVEHLGALLHEAVACRLRSAFPVGAHLSGGLDSSPLAVIAARALRQAGRSLTTFSWSPAFAAEDGPLTDERGVIEDICAREAISCHYSTTTMQDVIDVYTRDFTTEPAEMMMREEQVQAQAAQDNIRVMLSGWGGDEVVTCHGFGYLAELFLGGRWATVGREVALQAQVRGLHGRAQLKRVAQTLSRAVLQPLVPNALWALWQPHLFYHTYPQTWIDRTFAKRYVDEVRALRTPPFRERPGFHAMQRRWLNHGHLSKRTESWAVSGAQHHLVYRYPLLDKRIVEFCLGIPPAQFCQDGWVRYLWRRAIDGIVPPRVQWNPSKAEPAAFGVIEGWIPRLFQTFLTQVCPGDTHPVAQYIDIPRLKEVIRESTEITLSTPGILHALSCFCIELIQERRLHSSLPQRSQ